jgi:hypothetical protein
MQTLYHRSSSYYRATGYGLPNGSQVSATRRVWRWGARFPLPDAYGAAAKNSRSHYTPAQPMILIPTYHPAQPKYSRTRQSFSGNPLERASPRQVGQFASKCVLGLICCILRNIRKYFHLCNEIIKCICMKYVSSRD